jgi:putative MATE family efflux protein
MRRITLDKDFYSTLVRLAVPIALQNLIGLGMNLIDTVMLGSLGEKQISASALANQPYFIFTLFIFGLCSGACVLTAQYWGKKDIETISRIVAFAIKSSVIVSAVFTAVVLIFPEAVISIYTGDAEVIRYGAQFLRIIGFSYIISGISLTYLYLQRSVENVRLPLMINLTSFVVNAFLNWVLIYGNLGAPAMGIRGSATATLTARILELVMALVYALGFDKILKFKPSYFVSTDKQLVSDFLRYSLPVVANETLWGLGISIESVIIGHISSQMVAANSIAGVVQRLGMVVIFGIANAAAVIVGKQIGSDNQEKARIYARKLLRVSVALGAVSSLLLLIIRDPMVGIYNVDPVTKGLACTMINVYAIVIIFQAFNTVNIVGILRGGGDTRFAMIIDVASLWGVALPLGAISGLVFHLPVAIFFFLMLGDEPTKFLIGVWRFRTGKWLQNVTR